MARKAYHYSTKAKKGVRGMVSMKSVQKQLDKIGFDYNLWGRAEVRELPNILLEHEEIYEAVNGIYDGGFALLVATNVRLLLVDKKPLNYLTVEDMRFDMINEIDYSHRLIGARISISAGNKNLSFMSGNQQRLRTAIGHVQRCMAEAKKQQTDHAEDQKAHLAQINQQLQAYLLAQHQQQESLRRQLEAVQAGSQSVGDVKIEEIKPSPELSDYLLAQSLLAQANLQASTQSQTTPPVQVQATTEPEPEPSLPPAPPALKPTPASPQMAELYAEGMREIFGNRTPEQKSSTKLPHLPNPFSFDLNPLHISLAKLPLAIRNRKFGRPSFHAHNVADQFLAARGAGTQ